MVRSSYNNNKICFFKIPASMMFGVLWLFGTLRVSQVASHRSLSGWPLNMKHRFLITDRDFWQWRLHSCVTPLSQSLFFSRSSSKLFFLSISFFSSHLLPSQYPSIFFLVDCNKTLVLQFVFALFAPSPAQPQLLPVVHGGGSLPSAKGIYSWNYTHSVCFPTRLTRSVILHMVQRLWSGWA